MGQRTGIERRVGFAVVGGLVILAIVVTVLAVNWGREAAQADEGSPPTSETTLVELDSDVEAPPTSEAPANDSTKTHTNENDATASTAVLSAPGTADSPSLRVTVYFNKAGRLVPVSRETKNTAAVAKAALIVLLRGPSSSEQAQGLTSAIPAGTTLRSVSLRDHVATVDLSTTFASGGGTSSMYERLGQLIYTLTEFATVDRVKIRLDGRDATALGGEGLLVGQPLAREDYQRMIEAPEGGTNPPTVSYRVYFTKSGALASYVRTVPYTSAVARAALDSLLAGPSDAEEMKGTSTAIPPRTRLNSVSINNKVATVDLSQQFASGGGSLSMYLRVGQLICTLTEFPSVDRVLLKLDGSAVTDLGGEGLLVNGPLSRSDWASIVR